MNLIKKQIDAVAFGFPVRILCEKGIQKTLKSIYGWKKEFDAKTF